MDNLTGQRFGNYQLTRLLGRGGSADVYLGEHIHLKTKAALKFIHDKLDTSAIEDFTKEAQTIATLKHMHIVRILEFGFEHQQPFFVMDYAQKGSLRERHPRGSCLPLPTVISYVKQVADALAYVHAKKLIHRDVKPENMLLDEHENILLSDFGIVTLVHTASSIELQERSGTVYYMAPEQIKGLPCPASDQYALAVVVYEWICGTRPFSGASFVEISMKHLMEPPPSLCKQVPTLSPQIEQVILKALSKDPQQRFPTIQDFSVALENACLLSIASHAALTVDPALLPTAPSIQDQKNELKTVPSSFQEVDTTVAKAKQILEPSSQVSIVDTPARVVATNPLLKRFSHKKAPVLVSLGLVVCLLIGLGSWLLLFPASHADQRYASQSRNTPTHQTVSSPTNTASVLNTQAPSKPTAQPDPTTQPVSIVRLTLTPTIATDPIVQLIPTPTTATDPIVQPTPTPMPTTNPIVQPTPTPTPVPNVSLPVASCSSIGSLVEADGVYSGGSEVGVLDVYYNSSTGDNCVYFQSLGAARGVLKKMFVTITACMQTTSGSICTGGLTNGSSSDSSNYYYYAGPVGVYAKGRCINASGGMVWNGVTYKIGTTPAASHCGS